jgi:hypothetical protein
MHRADPILLSLIVVACAVLPVGLALPVCMVLGLVFGMNARRA